ncbi:MAG TPA: glutathione S-transferase family protein [Alphaproteobacteria bacterium]|nr:glutathione S-transferase family protein [Alphaproteobacteria bacterium]HCO89884.1 glutathione S-transferase family protein [Alphaproteobacteria bacterium]
MSLTIYGVSASRAIRTLWAAEELGLDYKHEPVDFTGGSRKPEFLKINPNGHIPAIDDDGVVIWESLACNLYLARKHGGGLWPDNIADEGRALQWSFWAMTEAEKPLLTLLLNKFMPEGGPSEAEVTAAREEVNVPLAVLNNALAGRDYLLGSDFTIADLNVASVLLWANMAGIDLSGYPDLAGWLARCAGRPALAAAQAK